VASIAGVFAAGFLFFAGAIVGVECETVVSFAFEAAVSP
jgi:hypothetical protein